MNKKYAAFQEKITKLKNEKLEAAKTLFEEESRAIFDKYPDLISFSWTQYTPYFNDGDTCYFSVNTDYPRLELAGEDDEVTSDDFSYDDESPEKKLVDKISEEVSALLDAVDNSDFENMFGDHVRVVVHRHDGVKTDDYEHD